MLSSFKDNVHEWLAHKIATYIHKEEFHGDDNGDF